MDTGLHRLFKRTIEFHAEFIIRPVVANHIDLGFRKFITILLINPALNTLYYLRTFESVNLVPSAAVGPIGSEKAFVVHALESHSEIIAVGVNRIRQVGNTPSIRNGILSRTIYV